MPAASSATATSPAPTISAQPPPVAMRPSFRSRPDRVSGIPIIRESRLLAADRPSARFHEKEKPNLRPKGLPPFALGHVRRRSRFAITSTPRSIDLQIPAVEGAGQLVHDLALTDR